MLVASEGEAGARATLVEMQKRIARGPGEALGVRSAPTAQEVREAFLVLTKRFHPARFARMPNDIQRLSNEVFLGIKAAYETLGKTGTAAMPIGAETQKMHAAVPVAPKAAAGNVPGKQAPPAQGAPAATRSQGAGSSVTQRIPIATPVAATTGVRARTPTGAPVGTAGVRARTPTGAPVGTAGVRARTPTGAPVGTAGARARTPSAPPGPTQGARAETGTPGHSGGASPGGSAAATPPDREASTPTSAAKSAIAPEDQGEVLRVHEFIAAKNWAAAQKAASALAVRHPGAKSFRALLCYARAREAQHTGKGEEAVAELQRALQLDPELAQAKSALSELLQRR